MPVEHLQRFERRKVIGKSKNVFRLTRGWWRRLTSRIWRYDFFISYHWDSGGQYAVGLAQRLRSRKFDCFLDRTDFAAGDVWVDEGRLALQHAKKLILVGTPQAISQSEPVKLELELFTKKNQHVIPICFGKPITELVDPNCRSMQLIPPETIWIIEDEASLLSAPTQRVIDEIARTSMLLTSRRLRAIIVGSVIALLSIAVVLVSIFGLYAEKNAREAVYQADVQQARRLTSESLRIGSDRKKVAVLLASHALGIMRGHGESLSAAQRALHELLPEESTQKLPVLGTVERPVPCIVSEEELIRVSSPRWKVRRDPSAQLTFYVNQAGSGPPHTTKLTSDGDPAGLISFTFSNDSRWLVTEGINLRTELRDLQQFDETAIALPIEFLICTFSSISPDSRWLASFGEYTGVSLWDLTIPNPTADTIRLDDHSELASCVAFSSDSLLLATGSTDDTVCLYSLRRRQPRKLTVLQRHNEDIDMVVFSPSGRWFVSRDSSRSTILWDLQSPSIQSSGVIIDTTAPDDARLFFTEDRLFIERAGTDDFKVIPLGTRLLLQKATEFVGRNLSHLEWDEFFTDKSYKKTFVEHPEGEPYPEPEEIF